MSTPITTASTSALPPLHERVGEIWMDGRFLPGPQANLNVLSHSLHYGTAVFEGIRVYSGLCFLPRSHLDRLAASASALGYSISYSTNELTAALYELIKRNCISDGYVRVIAWLGSDALGLMAADLSVHLAISVWNWPQVHNLTDENQGISVLISDVRRPGHGALPPQAKASGGYLVGALAYQAARKLNYNDSILRDHEGLIAESTSANLFFVKDGILLTPIADRFLNGLTRQTIIRLAKSQGISVREGRFNESDLMGAQEIFLTGTAVELQPVTRVNHSVFTLGPTTIRLRKAYSECVRKPNAEEELFPQDQSAGF